MKKSVLVPILFSALAALASARQLPGILTDVCHEGPPEPLPDIIGPLNATYPLNITLEPRVVVHGQIEKFAITGLSSLHFQYGFRGDVEPHKADAVFAVTFGNLGFYMAYDAEGELDGFNFTGNGNGSLVLEGLLLQGSASVTLDEKDIIASVDGLSLNVHFNKFALDLQNFVIGGELVDWATMNEAITGAFDSLWELVGPLLSEQIRLAINAAIEAGWEGLSTLKSLQEPDCDIENIYTLPATVSSTQATVSSTQATVSSSSSSDGSTSSGTGNTASTTPVVEGTTSSTLMLLQSVFMNLFNAIWD